MKVNNPINPLEPAKTFDPIKWIKTNRPILNITQLEIRINVPGHTLHDLIQGHDISPKHIPIIEREMGIILQYPQNAIIEAYIKTELACYKTIATRYKAILIHPAKFDEIEKASTTARHDQLMQSLCDLYVILASADKVLSNTFYIQCMNASPYLYDKLKPIKVNLEAK